MELRSYLERNEALPVGADGGRGTLHSFSSQKADETGVPEPSSKPQLVNRLPWSVKVLTRKRGSQSGRCHIV